MLMSTYIRIFDGLTMVSALYRRFYVHIETRLLFMSTYIKIFNGDILIFELLCPHRDQSVLYVHIHQDFNEIPEDMSYIYVFLCPHRQLSDTYVLIHQDIYKPH